LPSIATLAQEYGINHEIVARVLESLERLVYPGPPGPEFDEYYVGDPLLPE
jgi:hypothetical protein